MLVRNKQVVYASQMSNNKAARLVLGRRNVSNSEQAKMNIYGSRLQFRPPSLAAISYIFAALFGILFWVFVIWLCL